MTLDTISQINSKNMEILVHPTPALFTMHQMPVLVLGLNSRNRTNSQIDRA
jgi:hypothetical protein